MKQLRQYTVKQLSPGMLQNPKSRELLESLRSKKRLPVRTDWTIEDEAATKLYRSENGKMGVPLQNIIAALIATGQHITYKGKKTISTAKSTIIFDFLEFRTEFCEFNGCDEKGDIPWTPFLQGGVMHQGSSETAVCITRPRIPHWSLTIPVVFDCDREINEKTVDALFEIAGRKIGFSDWRPTKKGRFGRFVIEKVEVLPIEDEKQVIEHITYTAETAPKEMLELAGV
ncbi:MAG: hypothetical protein A3B11_00135 [Candidatus Taylorbacteria bacterium RIFCSPLOWO2_01_FULL_44_26]|uniref:Uncharacterized protein n=2 Tax=Candidatus Tayloriibacteriota TaxID=1817919 RepID=A0A1G2ML11_9BACT|nr:MAG: hypothetical protein A3D50_01775 [Candidatus Taylorbacteria bacterium RIFCSPHIGHO2_02_FULL_44_12]OHA31099.1 MAG: hypothetical protein A3B11_00135 [Candidatus Taylorbacteria bacterium RIFCSPLOWO2_01_FULL_44_26]